MTIVQFMIFFVFDFEVRQTVGNLQKQQTKLRSALDEGLRSSVAETRAVLSQLKALETTTHEQHADIQHRIAKNQVLLY